MAGNVGLEIGFFEIWYRAELKVFTGDKRAFKVIATILKTLNMKPHDNAKKSEKSCSLWCILCKLGSWNRLVGIGLRFWKHCDT